MRRFLVAAAAAIAICLPALAQPGPPFALGVEVPSLSDLAKLGPDLRAAGINTVVAPAPPGGSVMSGLWDAFDLGFMTWLECDFMIGSMSAEEDDRQRLLRAYDYGYWTRQGPGYGRHFLFPPRTGSGLTWDQYQALVLCAQAGDAGTDCAASFRLSQMAHGAEDLPRGARVAAIYITPKDVLSVPAKTLKDMFSDPARMGVPEASPRGLRLASDHRYDAVAVFLGDGPQADKLTEAALEAAASAVLEGGAGSGVLFLHPANDGLRQMQLAVAAKLSARLGGGVKPNPLIDLSMRRGQCQVDASPLLWRLKRYGEVSTSGLTPYVTPDGSTGYNVAGQALLDLPIPNRSAWVDAQHLTRFSLRMFSTVEGQGALLALSTAGEISFVRVPIVTGWHLYNLDLTKSTWESEKPAGQKWGGSTGVIQALSFVPTPQAGSEIAFDWIRLEPDATGEVVWGMDKAGESAKIGGVADAAVDGGQLHGKATGDTVTVDLAVPGGSLDVHTLPFLSFKTAGAPRGQSSAASGTAQVEYWDRRNGAELAGGTASFPLDKDLPAQCVDLSRLGFIGAPVEGAENWGGPDRRIARLRLTLPATKDQDWSLDWVRLGPNYDVRAVPAEEPPGQ